MDPMLQRLGDVTIQRLEKPKDCKVGLQGDSDPVEKEKKADTLPIPQAEPSAPPATVHPEPVTPVATTFDPAIEEPSANIDEALTTKRNFEGLPGPSTKRIKFDEEGKFIRDDLSNRSFSDNDMSDYDSESEIESDIDLNVPDVRLPKPKPPECEQENTNSNFEEEESQEPNPDFLDTLGQDDFIDEGAIKIEPVNKPDDDYDYDIKEKLKEMGEISFETVKKGDAKPKKPEIAETEVSVVPTKKVEEDSSLGERKGGNMRRNIREVMDETKLDESTLAAQRQEMERLRRVQEQQRLIREVQRQMAQERVISLLQGSNNLPKPGTSGGTKIGNTVLVKLPNGQTKPMTKLNKKPFDLLRVPKGSISPHQKQSRGMIPMKRPLPTSQANLTPSVSIAPVGKRPILMSQPPSESDSDTEDSMHHKPIFHPKAKEPVQTIDISSDDDCIVVSESENDPHSDDVEDPTNSGMHTNDEFNQPDEQGRVVINIGHPEDESDIYLAPQIARIIKPHQIGGIRFLYDNLIESTKRFEHSTGFGCILAHSMGLGKTLQVVCFSDIFLRHTPARTILCIMPINTLQNWMAEYNMWVPTEDGTSQSPLLSHGEVRPRNFNLHVLNDSHKTLAARAKVIHEWKHAGGVLLIGYEQYRLLSLRKYPRSRSKNSKKPEQKILDDKMLFDEVHEALVKPGPDLVICDEGHRIKNSHASISQALKQMKTKRRVVLTGYPLQNNLMEYWCMVDFVRPNYLGTKTEFCNMFERPIQNGQCIDSTEADIKLMRYRAHVLHSLLVGFVQRRSHRVLQTALPQKEEYVLLVRMTEFQRTLYETFMNEVVRTQTVPNPLKAFAVCCKIWNHPDVLYYFLKKQAKGEAVDIDLEEVSNSVAASETPKKPKGRAKRPSRAKNAKPAASVTPYNTNTSIDSSQKPNMQQNQLTNVQSSQNSQNSDNNFPKPPICTVSSSNFNPKQSNSNPPTNFHEHFSQQNFSNSNPGFSNNLQNFSGGGNQANFQKPDYSNVPNELANFGNSQNSFSNNSQGHQHQTFTGNTQTQNSGNQSQGFNSSVQNQNSTNSQSQGFANSIQNPANQSQGFNSNQNSGNQSQGFSGTLQAQTSSNRSQGFNTGTQNQTSGNQSFTNNQNFQIKTNQNFNTDYTNGTNNFSQNFSNQNQQGFSNSAQSPNFVSQSSQGQQNFTSSSSRSSTFTSNSNVIGQPNPNNQLVPSPPQNMQFRNNQSFGNSPQNYQQQNPNYSQNSQSQNFNYQNQNYWNSGQDVKPPTDDNYYNNFGQPYNQNQMYLNNQWIKKEDVKPPIGNMLMGQVKTENDVKPKINIISDIKFTNVYDSLGNISPEKKINILSDIKLEPKKEEPDYKEDFSQEFKSEHVQECCKGESKSENDEDLKIVNEATALAKNAPPTPIPQKEDTGIPYDWAKELLKDYVPGFIENSAKMEILFCIIKESLTLGDRLLVFSQSLITLDLIEQFLQMNVVPGEETLHWAKNTNYYRLDGSTSALEREKLINEFNSNPKVYLFLVSTRAGSLGINLIGANRVVVLDASWNPCHDTQAVCRVYRYGQRKPCFVYRFVVDNCLEKKIYDRQINKQGMSDRVVDECNPDAHLTMKDVSTLCWDDEQETEEQDWSHTKDNYIDVVLQKVLEQHGRRFNKEPFQHESLLIDRKDKQLSRQEKRLAKKGYEREKQAARQPSYGLAANPRGHRPVASVRPMQQGGERPTRWIPAEHWQRQGMTAQEMTLPLDVVIPTNQPDKGNIVLKAGQKVLVLKSPKGVYMQLESGKIVAIKTAIKVRGKAEEDANKVKASLPPAIKNNSAISVLPQKRPMKPFNPGGMGKFNLRSVKQAVPNLVSQIQKVGKKMQTGKARPYQIGTEIAKAVRSNSDIDSHPVSSSEDERSSDKRFQFRGDGQISLLKPRLSRSESDEGDMQRSEDDSMGSSKDDMPQNYKHFNKQGLGKNVSSSALQQLEQSTSAIMSESKQPFQETLDSITSSYQEDKSNESMPHKEPTVVQTQPIQIEDDSPGESEEQYESTPPQSSSTQDPPIKADIPTPEYGSYNNYYGYNHMQPYPPPPPQGYPGYPPPQPPPYDMNMYPQQQQPPYTYGAYPQGYPPPQQYPPPQPYEYGPPGTQPMYSGYPPYPPPAQQYAAPPPPQGYPPPPASAAPYPDYQYTAAPPPVASTYYPPQT